MFTTYDTYADHYDAIYDICGTNEQARVYLSNLISQLEEGVEDTKETHNRVEELENELADVQTALDEANERIKELEDSIEELNKQLEDFAGYIKGA